MQVSQVMWTENKGWSPVKTTSVVQDPNLILYFGTRKILEAGTTYQDLKKKYPKSHILGCSGGGEILDNQILDETTVAALIKLDKTPIRTAKAEVKASKDSFEAGKTIGQELQAEGLSAVFILSDGLLVNGSALVQGITSVIGRKIPLTGGLAGDGESFRKTMVGLDEEPLPGRVAAIGFYGDAVQVGHGSVGGWDVFGPERLVTKSEGNVLYELDGKPALQLYKKYLGEEADRLPGSALLFPLAIRPSTSSNEWVVRTILSINEEDQSMTFAGDIPEGYVSQLMHGNFDRLVSGAYEAALQASLSETKQEKIGILISCIGRKLLMGQHTVDELQVVYDHWSQNVPLVGFYSYGEISPHSITGVCGLHNQTMTITTIGER
jgi:hypothetical protein